MSHVRPAARWESVPAAPADVAERLAEARSRPSGARADKPAIPLAIFRLLAARGIRSVDEAKRFLRPALEHVESPDAMIDLPRAADRLARAMRGGETILVHGDYDVDGICSTTLMTRALRQLGGTVVPFIPNRRHRRLRPRSRRRGGGEGGGRDRGAHLRLRHDRARAGAGR